MSIGFRICTREQVASKELVEAFSKLPVANVSDSMSRLSAAGPALRPMHASGGMAGVAITVKCRPGDNLMLHKAIDMAVPGDVIVVDAGGETTNALMGELMLAYAIKRGVVGFVLNGAIRDLDAFVETNLPTFAVGVTHRGPYKDGPGEINVPISLGGMVINPGDIVIGDADGVLSVPLADAEEVLAKTEAKQDAEVRQMKAIAEGTNDRTWVDAALKKLGCALPTE
ncbi:MULTISPECIES: RraA family protein [unclassified Salipiger]|uniref:RraA family protein n=1 Tax=unclassified Salipiger TaxID=2640570 RepID=UPI0013B80350|nr:MULTISPECIES: RraA family protein [unclassified Salipiger]NDV51156.1 RraA family protein [Salipiger sp. PrR003]NDW32925.1 RraA family protein [Salipiger sp. PrR007]